MWLLLCFSQKSVQTADQLIVLCRAHKVVKARPEEEILKVATTLEALCGPKNAKQNIRSPEEVKEDIMAALGINTPITWLPYCRFFEDLLGCQGGKNLCNCAHNLYLSWLVFMPAWQSLLIQSGNMQKASRFNRGPAG